MFQLKRNHYLANLALLVLFLFVFSNVQGQNQSPVAIISTPSSNIQLGTEIAFNGSTSYDPDGPFINHFWNFDDGTTAYGSSPSHIYQTPGIYTITLLVTDLYGASDSKQIKVAVSAPCGTYSTLVPVEEDVTIQVGTVLNEQTIQAGNNKVSYLKLNTENIFGAIAKTELRLSYEGLNTESGNVEVYAADNTAWSEGTITSSNAPSATTLLASKDTIYSLGGIFYWDLQSTVKEEFTVILSTPDVGVNFIFGASEYYFDDGKPMARVTVNNSACLGQFNLDNSIYLEAECAIVGSNWQKKNIGSASNGRYVLYPGTLQEYGPPSSMARLVRFPIFLNEATTYEVWTRIQVNNYVNNSFWVRINSSPWMKFADIPKKPGYKWEQVYDQNNNNQLLTYNFPAGYSFVDIAVMEDGTRLDKLGLIPPNSTPPTAKGPPAYNCPTNLNDTNSYSSKIQNANPITSKNAFTLSPNPFNNEVILDMNFDLETVDVRLFNAVGQLVAEYNNINTTESLRLGDKLKQGIYFVHIQAGKQSFQKKVLKINN